MLKNLLDRVAEPLLFVLFVFLLLFVYTKLVGPIPFSVDSVATTKNDTFSVSGEGKYSTKPDLAIIHAGVLASGNTVKEAQNALNDAISKVANAVKASGVDPKDISTENYNISPTQDYNSAKPRITGYSASANLAIKVRNIESASNVVDASTTAGANQIGGISFEVSNKEQAVNEARKLAVADARKKAESAANIAGFKLGKIINYSEDQAGNNPRPMMVGAMDSTAKAAPTQLELGSTDITITVQLSYQIF